MKKLLLICLTLSAFSTLKAQTSGGPDGYGYIWRDSNDPNGPAYNWVDITGYQDAVRVLNLTDDNTVGPFLLSGQFQYYWYTVSRFWISANGTILFNGGTIASPFPFIPDTLGSQNFIAGQASDLILDTIGPAIGNIGQCWYWVSPNSDSLVVSWIDVPFWQSGTPSYTGQNTFQIILNFNDSTITCQYNTQIGSSAAAVDFAEIGIENNSGTIGLEHSHDIYPPTSYAIRYYPPTSTTLQIDDASTSWNDNPGNEARILSKNGNPMHINALISNTGNSALPSFDVISTVRSSTGGLALADTATSNPLNPTQTMLINQANPFVPTTAGNFHLTTTTKLPGDATPSNNSRVLEIPVVDTTQTSIELSYDNGVAIAGTGGISWSGGDGGCANSFVPPFYPCNLTMVKAFIVDDPNAVGYFMKVYADNGPNKTPGTLLDSVFVAPGTFTVGTFVSTALNAPILIDSGGFYVTWYMAGDGIGLGQNLVSTNNPASFRTYEVLGGTYTEYRSRDVEDLMIRAVIQIVGVGVHEISAVDGFGSFYPNPASDISSIEFDATKLNGKSLLVSIYSTDGKLVNSQKMNSGTGKIDINVKNLNTGVYLVTINSGNKEIQRKLNVIK